MFRPTWPSSGVYDVSLFYIPEGICFAPFVAFSCTWLYYARFHFFLCVFVSFLILVCVFAFLPLLVVCRICATKAAKQIQAQHQEKHMSSTWLATSHWQKLA
jgi:hypothetical protein